MKIAVFGLGISAIGVLRVLAQEDHDVYVVNRGEGWEEQALSISGKFICVKEELAAELFASCDEIILSPGIPRSHKALKFAHKKQIPIISEIEFAFRRSKVPVIAVTGSNGKTTTVTMIAESLELFEKKVFLGGNIGRSYCEILEHDGEYDYAVVEVSSFQLESVNTFAPIISIITNLTPNHMERYTSFEDYVHAKLQIFKNQKEGTLIAPESVKAPAFLEKLSVKELEGYQFENPKVIGRHNRRNFYCAYEVCKKLCDNFSQDVFQGFINNFSGVKYRLEYLGQKHGMDFYNDGKSTSLEATLTSLKALEDREVCLILGGKLRSSDVSAYKILDGHKGLEIMAFGEAAKSLGEKLKVEIYGSLEDIFERLKEKRSDTVLFSPGFPSFDLYTNYVERAEHFESLVSEL